MNIMIWNVCAVQSGLVFRARLQAAPAGASFAGTRLRICRAVRTRRAQPVYVVVVVVLTPQIRRAVLRGHAQQGRAGEAQVRHRGCAAVVVWFHCAGKCCVLRSTVGCT